MGARVKDLYVLLDAHQSGLKGLIAETRLREFDKRAVDNRFDALDRSHTDLQSFAQEFGQYREQMNGALQNVAVNPANGLKSSRDDVEQMLTVQQDWGRKTKGLRNW